MLKKKNHFLPLLPLLTCCLLSSALAQAPNTGGNDFGSEIINYALHSSKAPSPLPLELVEEGDGESVKAEGSDTPPPEERPSDIATYGDDEDDKVDPAASLDSQSTTILNAAEIEIATLVKAFSKIAKRNYILDSSVKGKVTVHLPATVTVGEALKIFDTILLMKGFTTVPVDKNLWKIVKAKDAKQTTIPTYVSTPDNPSDALITQLVNLKYISATDMQQAISQFVSGDGMVTSFEGTNALIVIDSALNIDRLIDLIKKLDVPSTDQEITIIPVLHAEATDIAGKINEILGEKEGDAQGSQVRVGNTPAARRTIAAAGARQQAPTGGQTVARKALPLKVLADERTNSVIVVADKEQTAKVQALIEQLDSKADLSSGRFYVYRLKHAEAEKISEILSGLISGNVVSSSGGSAGTTGSSISRSQQLSQQSEAEGLASARNASFGSRSQSRSNFRTQRQSRASAAQSGASNSSTPSVVGGKVSFEGEVTIAPDPATNSLIINATRSDYLRIVEVIDMLDQQRRQVLVEATILEVSLNKDEGMGFELQGTLASDNSGFFAQNNYGGLTNVLTNPAALQDLTLAAASTGTVTLPGGLTIPSQALLVSAVSRNSNVNVLSTPTIVATDNEEAEIIVGENVPFVTSTSTDSTALDNTFNQIERQDVGITLRITPQISTGDFVLLKIFVEISNVVPGTRNDPNGPTTTIRTTDTTVELKSGQMVITGGLISDSVTDASRGIPYLKDIPVLGNLFRRDDQNQNRTNLLVFLTPSILSNQYDQRDQTKTFAGNLESVIEKGRVKPDRKSTLEDPRIDRVVETIPPPGTKPTTITSPNYQSEMRGKLLDEYPLSSSPLVTPGTRPKTATVSPALPKAVEATKKKDEVISVSVSPNLPSVAKAAPVKEEEKKAEPTAAIEEKPANITKKVESAPPTTNTPASTKQFIVLKDLGEGPLSREEVPLQFIDDSLGMTVEGAAGSEQAQFFEIGIRYKYASPDGRSRLFLCLGKYGSLEEAKESHKELRAEAAWNNLAPSDAANLGLGPWKVEQ